ncbi:MAG: helix-turn-helix transcriptional regulator [Myxococcales bacterium]|nr:helix-turn-helix transcriptional regulator [Myxococcales bacterium]
MSARGWDIDWRRLTDGAQLTLVEAGGCEWRAGRFVGRRSAGTVSVVARGELALGSRIFGPSDFFQVEIDDDRFARGLRTGERSDRASASAAAKLARAVRSHDGPLATESALLELLSLLDARAANDHRVDAARSDHFAARRMRDLLLERYAEPLTLDDLARAARVSPYYGLRVFRGAYGVPPFEYLVHVRLQRARSALRGGRRAVDVAAETGFADQAHLTRWFRRMFRTTPSTFAKALVPTQARTPEGNPRA